MPESPRSVDISVRLYQALLRVYPASFRRKYQREMARLFRDLATDSARRQGTAGLGRMWFRVLGDLIRSAFCEHLAEIQGRLEMKTLPGWIANLLAVLSVACFWVIPISPILSIAALSTTRGSQGWPRKTAVTGAILCVCYGLLLASLFGWLLFLRVLNGSWAF